MSNPDDPSEQREVLSSLPRSRRQRPSARREAARAGRAPKAKAAAASTAKKPTARAKPKAAAAKPRARKQAPKPRAVIPPAGYATPSTHRGHGSADPGAAIAGVLRSVLRRLPFR